MKKENKQAIAMPFNWIFAIIAGLIILFLAIYGASRIIRTGEYQISTETAAKIELLLDPIRPGLASGKSETLNFRKDARTYYECSDLGVWGKQTIAFSEKTFGDFGEKGGEINTMKYIFAEKIIEGKKLHLFSKPLYFPFKVDDLIMIFGEDYCFYQAPDNVKEEIKNLNLDIYFTDNLNDRNCTGTRVCFNSQCEISVYGLCEDYECSSRYDYGKIFKNGKTLYYQDSLLYAGIVSSPDIYECNLKRLMKKFSEVSDIYIKKIEVIELKGCSSSIKPELMVMKQDAEALKSSEELFLLSLKAEAVDKKNNAAIESCKLY